MSNFLKHLFDKNNNIQETETDCKNLTTTNECSLVSQIKELQLELDNVSAQIKQKEDERYSFNNIQSLITFLKEMSDCAYMKELYMKRYNCDNGVGYYAIMDICDHIGRIRNMDEVISDIKDITQYENKIYELRVKRKDIEKRICELKNQLGIK